MEILLNFREDTFLNDLDRGRAEAERVERGAQKAWERALRAEEEARRLKGVARAEAERLRALRWSAGIVLPDRA